MDGDVAANGEVKEVESSMLDVFAGMLKPKAKGPKVNSRGKKVLPPEFQQDRAGYYLVNGRKCRFVGAQNKWQRDVEWDRPENMLGEWGPLEGYPHFIIAPAKLKWVGKNDWKPVFLIKTDSEIQCWEVYE